MRAILICATLTLVGSSWWSWQGVVRAEPASPVERLVWMSGCWESVRGDLVVEEHWMEPRGGLMLGMSRTLRAGRAIAHEHLRISEQDRDLVLVAQPSGQAVTEFRAVAIQDSVAAFENRQHDFPQRVTYRPGPDSLWARIEGVTERGERAVDFRLGRIACH